MFDLISIGDTVIDTFIPLQDAEIVTSPITHSVLIGLKMGNKIQVGSSSSLVGGNAANNAVGSARLKLKTAIYTHVGNFGDDKADDRIVQKFKNEKVDTRYVIQTDEFPSNQHIVLDFQGERTILVHHQPWKFHLPELDKTKWVYLTSLSPSFTESFLYDQLISFLERVGARLIYNPGTFQLKLGIKKYPRLLSLTELFIVNLEESKLILGIGQATEVSIKKLLKGLAGLGPKMVIITDGKRGSYGFDGESFIKLGIFPAKLVEMTGSGDAFATGTLAGLFYGKTLEQAMRWGAANGAAVVEQIGPQAGLLTIEQMMVRLKENPKITPKQLN